MAGGVFLGVHYPVDIAGAAFIGLLPAFALASDTGRALVDRIVAALERCTGRLWSAITRRSSR